MDDDHALLPAGLWIAAFLRRCDLAAVPAYVRHRGDADRGMILVWVHDLPRDRCRLLQQGRDQRGRLVFHDARDEDPYIDPLRAAEQVRRARARDPDIWVVEVDSEAAVAFLGFH
jgi:hypothetical protein